MEYVPRRSQRRAGAIAVSVILEHLVALYGEDKGRATFQRLATILDNYSPYFTPQVSSQRLYNLSERDALFITYGDQVQSTDAPPLRTLSDFCARHLKGLVSGIHVLPFYPYSSDDGFAVMDYRAVNPALGTWGDIARLGQNFLLMFDAVINHVSAESQWFTRFLQDDSRYSDFFIVVPDGVDLSKVMRPRTLPLLTLFRTSSGKKNVWTTFSPDQIDLNYRNPDVLLEIVDTLLFYVVRGARFVRLDAVAFLWKEPGTTCVHLPQTHRIVQLLRAVLDQTAPYVMLITETNVPHAENLSYFGDGSNEAQMVYNFALPPLVLHTFQTESARTLSTWASELTLPSDRVTFFNFLASHDGIGLNPVRGILSEEEIQGLVLHAQAHGGQITFKNNPDGTASPYELNINYFDALSNPLTNEPISVQVARFIAAQGIMLCLIGVPGLYFHSMFGSRGWPEGVVQTGHNRAVNREKCDLLALESELADPGSRRSTVFAKYGHLLRARAAHPAFHPMGRMRVLDAGASIFAVLRTAPDGTDVVLCLQNVSSRLQSITPDTWCAFDRPMTSLVDLLTGHRIDPAEMIWMDPYQILWVTTTNK